MEAAGRFWQMRLTGVERALLPMEESPMQHPKQPGA